MKTAKYLLFVSFIVGIASYEDFGAPGCRLTFSFVLHRGDSPRNSARWTRLRELLL